MEDSDPLSIYRVQADTCPRENIMKLNEISL